MESLLTLSHTRILIFYLTGSAEATIQDVVSMTISFILGNHIICCAVI